MKLTVTMLKRVTTLALLVVFTTSCSKNEFTGTNSKAATAFVPVVLPNGDLQFIGDSFERDNIADDNGWRGFVNDGGTPVISFQSNGAGARIPPAGEFGPAADGERFLLLNGRPNGEAIEKSYVISQSYDLAQYNTVVLTFRYLTIGLNDAGEEIPETLKLQVCRGTLNECGANDDVLNAGGLESNNWVDVNYTSGPAVNDDNFNGKNHTAGDWQTGVAAIDLRELVGNGSTFVFRFVGTMKDGIKPEDCSGQAALKAAGGLKTGIDPWTGKQWDYSKHSYCKFHKKYKCKDRHDDGNHYGWCKHKHDHRCKHNHHVCPVPSPTPNPTPVPTPTPTPVPSPTPTPPQCVPSDGTLQDGILIDQISGRATETLIGDVF